MNRRELFGVLSREPERRWPEGVIHHGVRLLVLVVLAASVTALFPVSLIPEVRPVERGGVLEEDVVAAVEFPVYKTPDELEREQQDAVARVNQIFVYDSTAIDSMLADVDDFFERVDSAAGEGDASRESALRLRALLSEHSLPAGSDELTIMLDPRTRAQLRRTVRNAIIDELPEGIARRGELEQYGQGQIRIVGPDGDRVVPADSVLDVGDFYDRARIYVPSNAPRGFQDLHRLILVRFNTPSLRHDPEATKVQQELARAAVDPVRTRIMEGQRIIPAREPVTEQDLERFRAYQQELQRLGDEEGRSGWRALGGFMVNLIILSLLGVLLYFYRPRVYQDARHVLVLATLVLAVVISAALVASLEHRAVLIPIAFPALVIAILWDGRLALNLSLIIAVLLTSQPPFLGLTALFTLVTAGAVASLAVRVVRRRAQIWGFIAMIAASYALVGVVLGLLRGWTALELGTHIGYGSIMAVASAFAAMGFLPVFEGFTRITTDQTLLELADVNRPLLRRLSMEAPGTYAHSISVANLAESAAGAIDADALLTRVGVYYHDIGKMERPHYFIENQPSGRNPHDRLKPATSAQVIRDHVVQGIKMAEDANLPECIRAFVAEHHGTQSISFFFDKAKEQNPDAELDPKAFCYPGPRPQSRETAILMLADSVESAARVLPDPTPEAIRELVDRIVQGKMDAGQLDDTPLTLRELTRIKDQFVNVLTGMYHQRIDYPPGSGGPGKVAGPAESEVTGGPGDAGSDQSPDTADAVRKTVETS